MKKAQHEHEGGRSEKVGWQGVHSDRTIDKDSQRQGSQQGKEGKKQSSPSQRRNVGAGQMSQSSRLTRVGDPQQIGGPDRFASWRVALSEDPSPEWRRQFLLYAYGSGLFDQRQMRVASGALIFVIERSALALTCEKIDEWIAQANGETVASSVTPGIDSREPDTPTILVVDDQPDIGPMARDILEPAGYVVLPTSDPLEAVRLAQQRPGAIDLLLTDVVMPLMDGRKLARRILSFRPNMKVILMSGYEVAGLAETGWPFIEKPWGIEALAQKVADTLREGRHRS
jgi:CheY-like chemotaxis protein